MLELAHCHDISCIYLMSSLSRLPTVDTRLNVHADVGYYGFGVRWKDTVLFDKIWMEGFPCFFYFTVSVCSLVVFPPAICFISISYFITRPLSVTPLLVYSLVPFIICTYPRRHFDMPSNLSIHTHQSPHGSRPFCFSAAIKDTYISPQIQTH